MDGDRAKTGDSETEWDELFLPILDVARTLREGVTLGRHFPIFPPPGRTHRKMPPRFLLTRYGVDPEHYSHPLQELFTRVVRDMLAEFFAQSRGGTIGDNALAHSTAAEIRAKGFISRIKRSGYHEHIRP